MGKRHKKHHHEEHVDESWLVPYADILTLLLALFIVLFAAANVDQQKMQQLSQVMQEAFHENGTGGNGVLDGGKTMEEQSGSNNGGGETPSSSDELPAEDAESPSEKEIQALAEELKREFEKLENLKVNIDTYIAAEGMQDDFTTLMNKKGLLITIQDGVLFESGSAEVKPDSIQIAQSVAGILAKEEPRSVVISGHTDNIPIRNGNFRSNWDLSAMRGINFLQVMIRNKSLKAENFSVSGYGEHHPVADNKTASGREKNRRVEVLILPNTVE